MDLAEFNRAPDEQAVEVLSACCDVPRWVAAVRDGRPYPDVEAAVKVADEAARSFTASEVDRALARHPRIGERAAGADTSASWSREEQAGVASDDTVQKALAEGNRAYEERFGRVFLICATGLSAEQILGALSSRLGNDPDTEAAVVADELRRIALLRLRKALTA
ncbi:MAG TPA: 2-oxo-4-hydroxy-4-carboxy-5-ureidoimidazoline decarboxylase [Nocardioidaceae bacterium]